MSADILKKILAAKSGEVDERRSARPLATLRSQVKDSPAPRDFAGALKSRAEKDGRAVIAEIKRASPSAGVIREYFDPATIARAYERGGATCLSVLTDESFFQGRNGFLQLARAACALPVLRKDFIVDEWQVWETRAVGADALLLIAAALDDTRLRDFSALGAELGLAVLVEVHDQNELERALAVPGSLVGINNRDLRRFQTDLETSIRLAPGVPEDRLVIAESGIRSRRDIARLHAGGIGAFLIGETLMRQPDPGAALARLIG